MHSIPFHFSCEPQELPLIPKAFLPLFLLLLVCIPLTASILQYYYFTYEHHKAFGNALDKNSSGKKVIQLFHLHSTVQTNRKRFIEQTNWCWRPVAPLHVFQGNLHSVMAILIPWAVFLCVSLFKVRAKNRTKKKKIQWKNKELSQARKRDDVDDIHLNKLK